MLGLSVYTFCFCWITYMMYKRKGMASSVFLLMLYTFSAATALGLVALDFYGTNPKIQDYDSGSLFLMVALFLFLYPFYDVNDGYIKCICIPDRRVLDVFATILTVLSLFSVIYFIPIAAEMMFVDVDEVYDLRVAVARGENPFITPTIYNTIAGTAATFYSVQQLLFFIYIIREHRRSYVKWFNWLILLSSFSYPVFVLAYMGRDGVVFWIITFISMLLLFKNFIHEDLAMKIKKAALYIMLPFALVLVFITVGRFVVSGPEGGHGLLYSIFNYFGQGPVNFAEIYYTDIRAMGFGKNVLPLFFGDQQVDLRYQLNQYGLVPWVFKTFVYNIYSDFGSFYTLLIGLGMALLYKFTFVEDRVKRTFSFQFVLLYTLFFTIYSQGLFYFRQYNRVGNLYIITLLMLAFVFLFVKQERVYVFPLTNNADEESENGSSVSPNTEETKSQ